MQSAFSSPSAGSGRSGVPGLDALTSPSPLSREPSSSPNPGIPRGSPNPDAISALETYKGRDTSKVVVRFKAVGNAPIMKQNFYKITASNRFQTVIQFLRKELGWKSGDALVSFSFVLVILRRCRLIGGMTSLRISTLLSRLHQTTPCLIYSKYGSCVVSQFCRVLMCLSTVFSVFKRMDT